MTTVLVVSNDPHMLRTLWSALTAAGYQVLIAADGPTALRGAAHARPDVVVLEPGLPDLDGTDLIGGLRAATTSPIIALSSRTSTRTRCGRWMPAPTTTSPNRSTCRSSLRGCGPRHRHHTQPTGAQDRRHRGVHRRSRGPERCWRDGAELRLATSS